MVALPTAFAKGRYEVLANISDVQDTAYVDAEDSQTVLVRDTEHSRCRTIRLVRVQSKIYQGVAAHLDAIRRLDVKAPHPLLLVPLDTFDFEADGGEKHLAIVYDELLGPDLSAMDMNLGQEHNFHEPEVVRHIGSHTAQALALVHSKGLTTDFSAASPVLTYPHLDQADADAVVKFYNYDGQFSNLNDSCTGPEDTPFNKSAMLYKLDRINTNGSYLKRCVPEAIFGEEVGPKADVWMLGCILLNLAAQTMPEINTISQFSSESTDAAVKNLEPSLAKGLITTIETLGNLPSRYVEQLPQDARAVVESGAIKFDKDALFNAVRNNGFAKYIAKEDLMTDDDLTKLVELLRRLLAHDPEDREGAAEATKAAYFAQQ